jgi:hypothetical protein
MGVVDRPAAARGRTAMYGPRHLLQLVAIKRLQAQGLPLVAIQAELAGATDAQLARVAQLPEAAAPPAAPVPPPRGPTATLRATPAMARPLTQGQAPAGAPAAGEAVAAAPAAGEGGTPATTPTLAAGRSLDRQARFWRERPAEGVDMVAASGAVAEAVGAAGAAGVATLQGVRLGERATLLLDPGRPLDDADLSAILAAARPLLRALRARGLDHPGREHP